MEKEKKTKKENLVLGICIVLICAGIISSIFYVNIHKKQKEAEQEAQQVVQTKPPRGHNEDENSNLGAWGRAMGSVLISMNDGDPYYFGGYEVNRANKKAAARILKQSWKISSRKDLLKKIQWLVETGDREEYQKEKKEMDALSRQEWNTAIKQLSGGLKVHYQNIRNNWLTWGRKGMVAWDLCRISHLVQWGYIAGYIELDEAQALLEPAATILKNEFHSWDEVINNWLDGYALAMTVSMEAPAPVSTPEGITASSQPTASAVTSSTPGSNATLSDYFYRKQIYEELVEGQEKRGLLYDEALFQEKIVPLEDISYTTIMKEVQKTKKKPTPTPSGKKKKRKKNKEEQ